ncbi:MAG TPA: AbrB/MazE/SpoVT family DNA-binding domain-containing protein [Anaerolineae bacterium]|nr:AbrB/MazE/SpoVT family DNA-binding domain-containing protein [Anaerolineae bacterium]
MITTITGKNQVTIPAKIARALDLRPGTRLDWIISEDGVLIVRPLPSRSQLAREAAGMGKNWLPAGADPVGDLIRERVQDDEDEGLL